MKTTQLQGRYLQHRHEMEYLGLALQMKKENGTDIILRGAPHILIVSSPGHSPRAPDAIIALSYFDLLAPTMGIGTLWNGLLKWCLELFPELRTRLGIPDGHQIGYAMLFGRPSVKYHRISIQTGAKINSVYSISNNESST